jgi:uroporphyrinogen decarboxylase
MRQAGRYMHEYRALREKYSLLEICRQPELAAEVTLQPINAFDFDASIIFADILLPIVPMGLELEFVKGKGPVIYNPVRSAEDIGALHSIEPVEELSATMEAITLVRQQLPANVPLIGFAAAPFTLASYMIEGSGSRNYRLAKSLMYQEPKAWHQLMEKVANMTIGYLKGQIAAGAQAVQLFDSWVGALSPNDYRQYVKPHSSAVLAALAETGVPRLHFGTNTATLIEDMVEAGGDVIGVDWRLPLDQGWRRIGYDRAIQGNLDPILLFAPEPLLRQQVRQILDKAEGRPGHIFNLGHGILPPTSREAVEIVIDEVHSYGS